MQMKYFTGNPQDLEGRMLLKLNVNIYVYSYSFYYISMQTHWQE